MLRIVIGTLHRGLYASFLSGGFITAILVNPPERKQAKLTSVHCFGDWRQREKLLQIKPPL